MHKAHETIWLQVDPDGESYDPEQWGLEDDATWCKDQINANDIKYVRADIAEAELAAARADAKEAWEKLSEQCIAHTATIQQLAAEQAKNVELLEIAKKGLRHYENRNIAHGTRNPAAIALDEIAATHEQSLTEYRNKVIEECALEADRQSEDEPYGHAKFRCANIALELRAMKEPE